MYALYQYIGYHVFINGIKKEQKFIQEDKKQLSVK